MEQANIKGIPYGVANFEQVRKEKLYYVDKTMYLPLLEEASNYLFLIRPGADIEAMLTEMKPWYNNYCFAEECINQERLYNCDMVLYYLRHQILYKCSPKEMVDKNIRTDYKKLKMLADIDRGNQRENRMSVIEEIAATGSIVMNLKTSFPAEYVTDDDNFRSLLYYYGLLTMKKNIGRRIEMTIPNNCIKEQYWNFMRDFFNKSVTMNIAYLQDQMDLMSFDGEWKPLLTRIATAYKENSSVRDSILGEHNLQGFFKAYLALNGLYLVEPEIELNYGYSDFLMLPDKARYPDIAHSYIMELKYVKPTASDAEIEEKSKEADKQLKKYSQDKIVIRLCEGTQLHLLKLVFRGAELAVCMENNPSLCHKNAKNSLKGKVSALRLKRQLSSIENQIKCSYPCSIPPHSAFTKKTMKSMKDSLTLRKRLGLEINRKLTDNLIAAHPLRQLFWECTLRCNLHCRHCGSDCKKIAGYQDMPKEDFLQVLDNIAAHTDPHKVFVILTGGEPLVREDLEDCGRAIYEKGFPWGMVTNGLYLTPERLERLLQAGMHTATVSLDGFKEEHNWMRGHPQSFDRATAAIRMLAALPGFVFDVVTCVNKHNYAYLEELKQYLIGIGLKRWRLFTVFPVGRAAHDAELQLSPEEFHGMLEFIKRTRQAKEIHISYGCEGFLGSYEGDVRDHLFNCQAGITVGSVLIDGSISSCPSIRADYHQGNIYQDDFMDVWENRFHPYRDREWMRTGECASCKYFRYCRGNGMHLRNEKGELLFCHLHKLNQK